MDDSKELLRRAAKAALGRTSIPDQHENMVRNGWDPRQDDGATFRLLVKLRINLELSASSATASHPELPAPVTVPFRAVDLGEYEGARLAIFRAAAALGAPNADQ